MATQRTKKMEHYVLQAINILQSIAKGVTQTAPDESCYVFEPADLTYIVGTLSEMSDEYVSLVHNLEMASLDRVKYYENSPDMVTTFRRHIQSMVPACHAQLLHKLENAMNSVKSVSSELEDLKEYWRSLRTDNERLKSVVEEVAKETELIIKSVTDYYNRRSEKKDAIATAFESINTTEERVSFVENVVSLEVEDWEEDEFMMRIKEYDLDLNLGLEKDELLFEEEAAATYDREESVLRDAITKLTNEMQFLKSNYHSNMIVVRAQNKINGAVVEKTLSERADRIADVERWARRIDSPLIYPESEEDDDHTKTDKGYESEDDEGAGKPPNMATAEDIELLFRPTDGNNEEDGFNKAEWEGVLGNFDTMDQLQNKIRTLVAKEKHLNDETQRLKRQLAAKIRKLDKLKKDLIELNDKTTKLQQNCGELYNRIRELEELDISLKEHSTKALQKMLVTTTEEQDLVKVLKDELKLLQYELADFVLVSNLEMADFRDAVTDQSENEEEIQMNTAIEFERHALMLVEIECGRIEWQCQEALRKELAAEYAYFIEQLRIFEEEYTRITTILDEEDAVFDGLYAFHTTKSGEMAVMCRDLQDELERAKAEVEVWKSCVIKARIINGDIQKNLNVSVSTGNTFSLQLEEDLDIISRAFVAYKIMSKICQNFTAYALDQTRPPVQAAGVLLQAIQKMVMNQPEIAQEVELKKQIGKKVTDRLIQSGSVTGEEYDQGAMSLRHTQENLLKLHTMSLSISELFTLTSTQSRKVTDIGDRFTSHLLRKQTSLNLTFNMRASGDGVSADEAE